jgi:multidrug efflux system outer membrane protein
MSNPTLSGARPARLVLMLLTASLLAGCSTLASQQAPSMAMPATYAATAAAKPADNSQTRWWLAFRDKRLDALIAQGLDQNLGIAAAVERINEANAGMISAGATMLPAASGSVSGSQRGQGSAEPTSSITYAGSASWVLDLFGQYANARVAAQANLDSAYFSADTARLTFLSELTNAYIDLRYYQESLALTRSSLATRRETLDLTKALLDSGAGSQLDVLQAQSTLDAASLQLPSLELGFVRSVNRLATLTADSAARLEADLQKGAPQPWPRLKVNAGVPADLIRQRPDIQAAERAVIAASAQAGIAEAQMYPSLMLTGSINLTQLAASIGTPSWSFGPTLNLPFLDGGRSRANHQAALSRVEQAYIAWQSSVRSAVEQTENALAAVRRDGRAIEGATKVKDSATRQLELARDSYQIGQGLLLDVLNAERALFDARAQLASATQQYAKNFVALNVAIGGGLAAL